MSFFRLCLAAVFINICAAATAQTTVFFQGFENASSTCTENWGYSGGNRNNQTSRTGTYSARVGRMGESNTLTFNTVNISGLTGVNLQMYHRVMSGSGPGLDTREGAVILVSLNGGAYVPVGQVGGYSDYSYTFASSPGGSGSASSGCTVYQCSNPLNYAVPAGTNTISVRVVSVGRNSSTCSAYNTAMNAGTAYSYDRSDEGFFIDDVKLTTTSTSLPGIWTGAVNTDWFNCANWGNNIVPTASTNVTIDQSASNNCVVGTSGTGTAVCNQLTISSSNGTNRSLTVQNNASLSCAGDVSINKTGGSGNLKLTVTDNAVFSCDDLNMNGSSAGAENAQFENETNTPLVTINGNITIGNGGVLDLTNSPDYGIVYLKGNYTNNGLETDFKQSGSYIYFTGTGTQNISTAGFNEIFSHIVINKPSGLLNLNNHTEIEDGIVFTNGILNTASSSLLIVNDGASATGMSHSAYTDGPVRKVGNDAFTFPVGDAGYYRPVSISAPSSASHHFTAQYFKTDPDPLYDDDLKDVSLDHVSSCEYWILDRTNGSSDVSVTLSWDAPSCGVSSLAELRVARWNGSMWKDHGNGGTTGTTAAGNIVTSGAVSAFSPFTLSSITANNPLPVELLRFDAKRDNQAVFTSWITASEQNTLFHIVERSVDGYNFMEIGRTGAAGFSNDIRYYDFTDFSPPENTGYYRLKTIDTDGSYSYSNIVAVNNSVPAVFSVTGYTGGISVKAGAAAELNIYSMSGQLIVNRQIKENETLEILLTEGIYLVTGRSGLQVFSQKVPVCR